MGNQGQASEETRRLCEYVWAGAIGEVHEAHIWTDRPSQGLFNEYWPQGCARPKDTPPVPATLDWDLWLGPAPLRPYQSGLPAVQMARLVGLRHRRPRRHRLPRHGPGLPRAEAGRAAQRPGRLHARERGDLPARLDGDLPVPGAPGRAPGQQLPREGPLRRRRRRRRHAALQAGLVRRRIAPAAARGLARRKADGRQRPPAGRRQGVHPRQRRLSRVTRQGDRRDSPRRFRARTTTTRSGSRACKGGKPAGSNFDWAGPLAESVLLGNVALRVQLREDLTLYKLLWDSAALKFTNLDEANQFLRRDYRAGWSLTVGRGNEARASVRTRNSHVACSFRCGEATSSRMPVPRAGFVRRCLRGEGHAEPQISARIIPRHGGDQLLGDQPLRDLFGAPEFDARAALASRRPWAP